MLMNVLPLPEMGGAKLAKTVSVINVFTAIISVKYQIQGIIFTDTILK